MKRIFVIFLIMIGLYLLFSNIGSWIPFGKGGTQEVITNGVRVVGIDVSGANTTIIPENRENIKADLDGKGEVTVKKNGDKIEVEYDKGWFNIFPFFNRTAKLHIYIPEEYEHDMSIEVGSGNLNFSGLSEKQPMELENLSLKMSSGNVNLKNINAAEFKHDGSSGRLNIDNLITETGVFDMSSGRVNINHYQGELKAEVSSGKLDIQMDKLTGNIDVKASSGHVKLDLPKDADFTLKGKASSGHISSNLPLKNQTQSKGDIEGTLGSGKYDVNVSISSGAVDIQ